MYVLRCAFGGANDAFVLCGSEDATVSLWSRDKGTVVAKIGDQKQPPTSSYMGDEGNPSTDENVGGGGLGCHTQVINCVSWSPSDPYIFATASDDHTVRIWGVPNDKNLCEVIEDSKDIKKIKTITSASQTGSTNGHLFPIIHSQDDD